MTKTAQILGLICARGGSKGVLRKNLRLLGGKPLITWSIQSALSCGVIDRLIVSTDDAEIARVAQDTGAEIPFTRPAELARDNSPEWPVWQHALDAMQEMHGYHADLLVVLPPTSPFRSAEDITAAVQMLEQKDCDIAISVKPAERNPYFNMVEMDPAGYCHLSKTLDGDLFRRQDAPPVFDMTTVVYAARADFVKRAQSIWEGRIQAVVIPPERALDIDTELDLKFAEFLLTQHSIQNT